MMPWRRQCIEWTACTRPYHWAYDRGWRPRHRTSIPVVSVGGLRMGGTGKTPMARSVVDYFLQNGIRVAVVSRGYRRQSRGVVVVSRGDGPVVDVRRCGDEPWMLASSTRAMVVVAEERRVAVEQAAMLGAEVAVLDDGFQHRRLARDLDIVLVDAAGPDWVMPFGAAREAPSALKRAQLVVGYGRRPSFARAAEEIWADVRFKQWRRLDGRPALPPKTAVLVSAIARPQRFAATVAQQGVRIAAHLAFRDHRWLTLRDLARAERACRALGADGLITTEKDAVRWPTRGQISVWVAHVELEITAGRARFDAALEAVCA